MFAGDAVDDDDVRLFVRGFPCTFIETVYNQFGSRSAFHC